MAPKLWKSKNGSDSDTSKESEKPAKEEAKPDGVIGKNGRFYSRERIEKLHAARIKSNAVKKAAGEATRLTEQAKRVAAKKEVEEKTSKAKKILEENAPPKPEITLDTIDKKDAWKSYYHEKYQKKKAELSAKHASPPQPKKSFPEHVNAIAKEELKSYVNSEAMKMAMKSIFM